jgi:hypothetical protein
MKYAKSSTLNIGEPSSGDISNKLSSIRRGVIISAINRLWAINRKYSQMKLDYERELLSRSYVKLKATIKDLTQVYKLDQEEKCLRWIK